MTVTTRPLEFGRRWNAKIPRSDIKAFLARTHVSTPWEVIVLRVNAAMDSGTGYTPAIRRQTLAFARIAWCDVLKFYRHVMRMDDIVDDTL